ncbi:CDP-glycerol glycerophosphotransferase family protein [Nocardioides sp. Kera G14]|uniref:CDP-glycerol glycerophosphotransferase family protein n=1 Tax=Nocardioides sp. Kera G14 TaxID=2884264 RepID=UPI001D126FFD|nr:CDP-glycerol glycerophosphotransferase family protein [Nocardioides sp. Kera G14]UDY22667.1 CDP-glycerol glycerophosphotransferase family protein [Nocardioides sp. Kera G14]
MSVSFPTTKTFLRHLDGLDADTRLLTEALAARSHFDPEFYVRMYPEVDRSELDPLAHYCLYGWREGRVPMRGFDSLWYSMTHLSQAPDMNPLAHFAAVGQRQRLATHRPSAPQWREPAALGDDVRRCVLVAAYDPDGLVDATLVRYIRELSLYGDVFVRFDTDLLPGEIDKLGPLTQGAWDGRHSTYDFGSYALLAEEHVGWERLTTYDELLLVNDSALLVRPLEETFTRMAAEPCDWWALQATANPVTRRFCPLNDSARQAATIPAAELADVFDEMLVGAELADFHLGSYFLAFRRPVVDRPEFRKWLGRARGVESKTGAISLEIGLTQLLIGHGHRFATFVPDLYPYHPVLGDPAFDLVAAGFPLLKRRLLTDNPYGVDVTDWRLRSGADRDTATEIEALTRRLPLSDEQFVLADQSAHPRDDVWAFPVCAYDNTLGGNDRAVFEQVRMDPSITKVVLTRALDIDVEGKNVVVVPLRSREGQDWLLQAGFVFTKHGPLLNIPWPLIPAHRVINLWHGIPLKRFGNASVDTSARSIISNIHLGCTAVITSSRIDSLAMGAAFHPLTVHDMWPTGLPRNDFITCDETRLPADMRADLDSLRRDVGDRRLVMFLPTFKNGQENAYYAFSPSEIERLAKWAEHHNAVIGVREHMADTARTYSKLLAPLDPIDLSSERFPNLEVLYRAADALISDYSSCLVDFQLTGRPVLSFAYDLDRYSSDERGLFYPLDQVLPGPVCRTFDELAAALDDVFEEPTAEERATYERKRSMFFDHVDDGAAARVVARVRAEFR